MKVLLLLALSCSVLFAKDDLSPLLEPLLEGRPVPGIAAAVVLDGEIVASGAAGVRKEGDSTPVKVSDRFHLGSCTKAMTATLAAMLVADGKIRWESTAAEIFPDLKIDPSYRGATLRQFLSNTGGAPTDVPPPLWNALMESKAEEAKQRQLLVEEILKAPPAYPPGQGSQYSNAGFSIAGAMLEKVAGKPYDQLLRERLFKPLGMKSAGFGMAAENGKVDEPYGHRLIGDSLVAILPFPFGDNPPAITPAGRVHATVEDFARFARFHLGKDKGALLKPEQLDFLHQAVPPSKDYAMGWARAERPWAHGTALTHTGSNTMFFAVMWLAPERSFAAVVVCNSGEGEKTCDAVVAALIGKYLEKK